ncbi:hypothetical protein J3459_006652 [Metarhizium acridum]|nr:hypothetical protein J3459_006652 [Metarhizium acridum]
MLSEENEQGLPFVKAQLLRRADMAVADGSATFSGKTKHLRLRRPTSSNLKAPLTEPDYWQLQSYIRLWRRTGWTLQDLDCVVVSFSGDGMRVTAQTITAMAAVYRISTLAGVDMLRRMPICTDAGLSLSLTVNDAGQRARQSDAELPAQQVAVAASDVMVNIQSRMAALPAVDTHDDGDANGRRGYCGGTLRPREGVARCGIY